MVTPAADEPVSLETTAEYGEQKVTSLGLVLLCEGIVTA